MNSMEIIKELIKITFPDDEWKFENGVNIYVGNVEPCINAYCKSAGWKTITQNSKWVDIKRNILKAIGIKKVGDKKCEHCNGLMPTAYSCNQCSFMHCLLCYEKLLNEGKGICNCPNCKSTVGHKMDKWTLMYFVDNIMNKNFKEYMTLVNYKKSQK